MNQQNILKNYGTKFDIKLDNSEFYDYKLGDGKKDYILVEVFPVEFNYNFIITDDDYILVTDDNDFIIYD